MRGGSDRRCSLADSRGQMSLQTSTCGQPPDGCMPSEVRTVFGCGGLLFGFRLGKELQSQPESKDWKVQIYPYSYQFTIQFKGTALAAE
jgi:hypothetical protein